MDRLLAIGTWFDWSALPRTIGGSILAHGSVSPKTLAGLNAEMEGMEAWLKF